MDQFVWRREGRHIGFPSVPACGQPDRIVQEKRHIPEVHNAVAVELVIRCDARAEYQRVRRSVKAAHYLSERGECSVPNKGWRRNSQRINVSFRLDFSNERCGTGGQIYGVQRPELPRNNPGPIDQVHRFGGGVPVKDSCSVPTAAAPTPTIVLPIATNAPVVRSMVPKR